MAEDTCEICGHKQPQGLTAYSDWQCKACGQEYDYDEGHKLVLSHDQRNLLRASKGLSPDAPPPSLEKPRCGCGWVFPKHPLVTDLAWPAPEVRQFRVLLTCPQCDKRIENVFALGEWQGFRVKE